MKNDVENKKKSLERIKQIMPIPQGFLVMEPVVQENGGEKMKPAYGVPFCLALVEGRYGDYVALYDLRIWGGISGNASLVPVHHCPYCGKTMEPHMELYDDGTLFYTCDCEKGGERE